MSTLQIKNTTAADATWVGQLILTGAYYSIPAIERNEWADDPQVFADIANGNLVLNDGMTDITDSKDGWKMLVGSQILPISALGGQLAVHPSTKPMAPGKEFYLQWTGAGDDVANGVIGEGDLLAFVLTSADASISKDIKFDPQFGKIYIHEGYAKWDHPIGVSGGGDHMSAMIMAEATPLQTSANLDYIVTDNWITYAGAGAGTHGLAGQPVLIPRTYSHDGDWDYDGTNLTPNLSGTGEYKMSDVMKTVHRYINKIPMCYASGPYNRLTSDETAYLPPGYFIRVTAFNVSGTDWSCAFMFEVYRERTAVP